MHEVKLGFKLKDYLTGKEIDATTYEDLRQEIARVLVEEKYYPKENIESKTKMEFEIEGKNLHREIDYVVFYNKKPIMVVTFCAGEIETYVRETLAMARLFKKGAAKFALITDTQNFILTFAKDGEIIKKGPFKEIPAWDEIITLNDNYPDFEFPSDKRPKEERILYALSALSCECRDSCNL